MPSKRLKGLFTQRAPRPAEVPEPAFVDAGLVAPGAPWGVEPDVREVRNFRWTPGDKSGETQRDVLSGGLLSLAGVVIAASSIGAGYVSYGSQKLFAIAYLAGADKGHHRASIIAALPDAGWIAMALVGLVAALLGRSSLRARVGVLLFFGLSLAAQVMYAPKTATGEWDVKALLVAVIAPIALAWMLESFVVEVRRWAAERRGLQIDETPILTAAIRGLGRAVRASARFPLWVARLILAPKETGRGVKDWFLDEAPLAPGRTRASLRAEEAVARAGTAEQIAEQARQQAAELVEQAQQTAAEQIAQTRGEAEQYVADARQAAAEQVEQIRAEMTARLEEIARQHTTEREQERRQADELLRRLRAEAADTIEQLRTANTRLAGEVDQLRAQNASLLGRMTAKDQLIAAYDELGRRGDRRYLDRGAAAEVARELYAGAGLASEGTARKYLYDYIDSVTVSRNGGRGTSDTRVSMSVNGVKGS